MDRLKFSYVFVLVTVLTAVMGGNLRTAFADDFTHMISGVVKSVDKGAKTMAVKADDGTEHTIKYTEKTAIVGAKDAGGDVKQGAHVTVKYTEKAGQKTAVGVKDVGKKAK